MKKKHNNFNLTKWLNKHCGCDVDKMMNGDKVELKKSERHFNKQTMIVRSKLIDFDNEERG